MKRGDNLYGADKPPRPYAGSAVDTKPLHLLLLLSLVTISCAEAVAASSEAVAQLARMSDALRSLSYEGTIVYLHESKLETLRIVHRVEDGQIREELVSLNGPVRSLTREKGNVTCALSDSHSISIPGHGVGKDVFRAWTLDPEALSDHYWVHALGTARVAGRQTDVVGIIPRDDLRYGYRFYLDRESGLPLKSDLMGPQADPIEQIMFASLKLLPSQAPAAAAAGAATGPHPIGTQNLIPDSLAWRFDTLPAGFALVMYDSWPDAGGQPVEHFVLSDGLASVSVYIESDPKEGLEGGTRIGAVHAIGGRVSDHQVTAVGEVPLQTVEAVLASIRQVSRERP